MKVFKVQKTISENSGGAVPSSVAAASSLSSLFLFHTGSNAGYAMVPLERLFYDVGLELGSGDPNKVHIAYAHLSRGRPANLPEDFQNFIACDVLHARAEDLQHLAHYIAKHQIRLVVFFDAQPIGHIFKLLRNAGAATILSYWGAPISAAVPWWKLALKRLEVGFSRSRVDGLIFESEAMAELAIHGRGVPAEMIDTVPLGVDTALFRPRESDYVYQTFGFSHDRKIVIYSGHMEPRKGVSVLIESAIELLVIRKRTDVCFLLCGNRDGESRRYEQMYAGLGLENLIRFGGYRFDLPQIYQGCFCGVIPSTGWDSFTCTSLEMAASGLPVVASRLQGLATAIVDHETGLLFEPGNAAELADDLELLLENPELAAQYGRNGRQRCESKLDLSKQRERFLAVLRKRMAKTS